MQLPSISARLSIAWPPNPPSEPTSTLILSTPDGQFVDVRLFLDQVTNEPVSLEWANAGRSSYETSGCAPGHRNGRWTHDIDSKNREGMTDEGLIERLDSEIELEKGRMEDDDGELKDYEEVWKSLNVIEKITADTPWRIIGKGLPSTTFEAPCGVCIRVGRWIQGIYKSSKEEVTVLRAVRKDDGWEISFGTGSAELQNEMLQASIRGSDSSGWSILASAEGGQPI